MADSFEFDPAGCNWLVRAYHTPLGDALRGNLSARLDVRHTIAAAGLPQPLAQLVYSVCRRTRLWRREKHDVARELIAHFADGLAAGHTADELAKSFGPSDQAASLIRRAKMRNRPLWWQSWRIASRALLLLLAVTLLGYCVLAARFYLGRPNIAHNYWRDINAARTVPDDQRGWLLYREAAFKLGEDQVDPDDMDHGPASKHWNAAVEKLDRHLESLELIRAAARKPVMGYLLGDPRDQLAARAANAEWLINDQSVEDNQQLIAALLPGPQEMRRLARFLVADAKRAAFADDGAPALADITALVGMAEQMFTPSATVVEQLFGIEIFGVATMTAGSMLADTPALWTEGQLGELAHRIAAFRLGAASIDFGLERMMFDDLLQRAYTDNEHGDGRITTAGLRMLVEFSEGRMPVLKALVADTGNKTSSETLAYLVGPGVAAWMGTREENHEMYHSLLDAMIAAHRGPSWTWDRERFDDLEDVAFGPPDSSTRRMRYWLVSLMLPALDASFSAVERMRMNQDVALTAIALELWHRRHGQWPKTLQEVVPALLPALPIDRADGQLLRYVMRDGKPLLYSVGEDRRDDGGHPSANPDSAMVTRFGKVAAKKRTLGDDALSGDSILWPPIVEKPGADDAGAADSP